MSSFDLQRFLANQRSRVEVLLERRLQASSARVPPRLHEAMRYALLGGGKRLRPILCLAFADAVAASSNGGGGLADDAACALEYVHTYSLIHDDLPSMDDDDLRRGRPTTHKVFGEAMAILAGDALLTDAFALLAGETADAAETAVRVALVRELSAAAGAAGMVAGQVLDIAEDRPAEEAYLVRMHALKTGCLIRAACRMGVLAARGTPEQVRMADAYGAAVGLAFQIADDVLDATSTSEVLGKPAGADAAAGRHTFPAVFGLDRSLKMARARAAEAVEAVSPLEGRSGPLTALAHYAVERER